MCLVLGEKSPLVHENINFGTKTQNQTVLSFINFMKIKFYLSCVANIESKKPGNFNTASKGESSEFPGKHTTSGQ